MTFATVVFGNISVATPVFQYTPGISISTARLLIIIPTINTGNNPIGIGFTYINQNNIQKTTSPANITNIPPNTPAGTLIPAKLEVGDTGILNIVSISKFVGGSTGDSLSFQSDATPPDTFGTLVVTSPGLTYTTGTGISTGGLRLFIVPKVNLGSAGIDIGFTYVNQFGIQKTTTVTTAVGAGTTSGTHIQVVLEPGDTGIQSLVLVNYFAGGTSGDNLSFESWNEGIGRIPIQIASVMPFTHIFEPYIGQWKGKSFEMLGTLPLVPIMYYSNPQISIPITFSKSTITGWIAEPTLRIPVSRLVNLADDIGARKEIVQWLPETLSKNNYSGRMFFVFRSWIESVVGQVLSGYVTNVNNQIIQNAFSMVLVSSTTTDVTAKSTTADVNPDSGLYQAFLKKVIYDTRYIIVKVGLKNIALQGAGTPTAVDGTKQLPIPYNLQFACPIKNCDFSITRKIQ